ncbi:hypothetical protein BS47DRAFT_1166375 [Hydnum rufescens UP504]|uniref:Uncharacterized protein n=1 Tax=Hydnum rufescens UP504 TaxID=1448309 RepID=A0A9P6DQW2_9AGAM|nr:hypothetical protein BS47DRAFT_1166375 [Hydnum rufescens UP504]
MMHLFNGVSEVQYLVIGGALLGKGEPVLQEFTKASSNLSDSAEILCDTSGGNLGPIQDWEIDLSDISLFKRNARNFPWNRFDMDSHRNLESRGYPFEIEKARTVKATSHPRGLNSA